MGIYKVGNLAFARPSAIRWTVFFPLERLPDEMFAEGVSWIDILEFAPDATCLFDFAEVTESGSE